jgi:siroheme synthase
LAVWWCAGAARISQAAINAQLVAFAATGARVVRLKGGDPFVFGRPRGECEALTAAGLAFRVLPGVSSCLAAPLLAGVPLTDPRCGAASFAVFSGADPEGELATGGWAKASGAADTLVFLMAVGCQTSTKGCQQCACLWLPVSRARHSKLVPLYRVHFDPSDFNFG